LASDPAALPDIQPNDLLGIGSLSDLLLGLGEHELHMTGVRHVRVDLRNSVRVTHIVCIFETELTHSTMCAVCSPPLLWRLVDLDVGDGEVGGIETLEVSVGPGVLEEVQKESGGLDGPASTSDTKLLSCANGNSLVILSFCGGLVCAVWEARLKTCKVWFRLMGEPRVHLDPETEFQPSRNHTLHPKLPLI